MKTLKMLPLILGLVVGLVAPMRTLSAADAEFKTVAIAECAGYDALHGSLGKIADLLGYKDTAEMMLMMVGDIEGLDKSKPLGVVVQTDGKELAVVGFLPVAKLADLEFPGLDALKGDFNDADKTLSVGGKRVKLTEKNGWLFVTKPGDEKFIPSGNPVALLEGLDKEYLIGWKVYTPNVPMSLVDAALSWYRQLIFSTLDQADNGDESVQETLDDAKKNFQKTLDAAMKSSENSMASVETLTFGLRISPTSGDVVLESFSTLIPGSELDKMLAKTLDAKTLWSDFYRPNDSVFTMQIFGLIPPSQTEMVRQLYKDQFDSIVRQVNRTLVDLEEKEIRETIVAVMEKVMAVIDATLAKEKIDFAVSLRNDLVLTLGGTIAEGDKLTEAAALVGKALAESENEDVQNFAKQLKINAAQFGGYTVSTFVLSDENAEFLGDIDPMLAEKSVGLLRAVKSDALMVFAGVDKKKVADTFKELASGERTEKPISQPVMRFSFPNLGVFLGNLLPNAPEPVTSIVSTLRKGDANAVLEINQGFGDHAVISHCVMKGECFKLIGNIIRAVQAAVDEEVEINLFNDN